MRSGTVAAMAMLVAAIGACGESSEADERVSSIPAVGFVDRFAPVVHLHSGETHFPVDADDLIDHATLEWSDGRGRRSTVAVGRLVAEGDRPALRASRLGDTDTGSAYEWPIGVRPGCPAPMCRGLTAESSDDTRPYKPRRGEKHLRESEGFVLDLDDGWTRGTRDVASEGSQAVLRGKPVYTEVMEEKLDGRFALRVTYWMLFGAEGPPTEPDKTNEGDWERVSVLLRRIEGGSRYEPVSVRFYQDGVRKDVEWGSVEVVEAGPGEPLGTHPVVYLGRGDHTPYPEAVDEGRQQAMSCESCPQWRTWESLVNADTEPWYRYGGAWGDMGESSADTGAPGPGFFVVR